MVDADALRIEKAIRKTQESGVESDLIDVLLQGALNWPLNHEEDEDIEIIRFLELGVPVQLIEVESGTHAVDFIEDVEIVERLLTAKSL